MQLSDSDLDDSLRGHAGYYLAKRALSLQTASEWFDQTEGQYVDTHKQAQEVARPLQRRSASPSNSKTAASVSSP